MRKWYKYRSHAHENNYQNLEWYQQELECARKALHLSNHQQS